MRFLKLQKYIGIFWNKTPAFREVNYTKKKDYTMTFEGKNILITGASSGIGKALAESLSKRKCNLALLSRKKDLIDEIAEKSNGSAKIITIKCDVTNKLEVQEAFEKVKTESGSQIDIAILNAGISRRADIKKFNSSDAEKIINTNVLGIIYCVENLIQDFISRKNGTIVGVSSLADSRGFPNSGFYSASKAAATKILESLRLELKPYNVKVITVKPGFVRTPMTDKNEFKMPFLMDVDEAAKIIIKGIEKEKSVIQFPFLTALGSKILSILPNTIYDFLLSLPLPKK